MSSVTRSPEQSIKEVLTFYQDKSELLEDLQFLAEGVCSSQLNNNELSIEEEEIGYQRYIEVREPLLGKLKHFDEKIEELVCSQWGNLEVLNSNNIDPVSLKKLSWLQARCRKIAQKVLTLDEKIISRLGTLQENLKLELIKTRTGKKAVQAYGPHSGKLK